MVSGGIHMSKMSFFVVVVAVLVLIGARTWTSTSALADSTVDPIAMMVSAKNLPTSHYVDYSVVFN